MIERAAIVKAMRCPRVMCCRVRCSR